MNPKGVGWSNRTKAFRSLGYGLLVIIGIGLAARAQITSSTEPPAPADSIVQLTAEAQGLARVLPADLPRTGTFWHVMPGGSMAPAPCPPMDFTLPVFQIADGQFLIDATRGQVAANWQQTATMTLTDALAAQANDLVNFIAWIQGVQLTRELAVAFGMEAELDSPSGFTPMMATIDPDSLFLEITNVSNGWSYLNLHNGTNQVYAIWTTTNLLTAWQVERELWPTNIAVMPFTVPTLGRENLFVRAEDWTGVDSNADGVPDWWAWRYFGSVDIVATNLDFSGSDLTFAEDYSNTIPPTVFKFTGLAVSNNYVCSSQPTVQLAVAGDPYYFATLVDDGNFSNAVWSTYSSPGVTVNLGLTEGWHEVWIGLRGHADAANTAVWQRKRLKLDWTPPVLTITNPTNEVVDVPLIQLKGFSPEALSSIHYDLTNALGLVTNQQVLIADQFYSTNTWEFTTNYFQGFDIFLTNGLNQITLHAADLAGNVTHTNFNFTVDYSSKTNPPIVKIFWPQNGQQIGGSSYTVRGWVNDPTASVTAELVIGGTTNTYEGVLERDGLFWVDNLPLTAATNGLTLAITDAAGNVTLTNLWVIKSPVEFSITPPDPDSLWNPTITVTGTISSNLWTVWGNGVQGTNNDNGTFTIPNVPLDQGGSATINVTLFPPGQNPPNGGGSGGNGGSSSGGAGSANPSDPNAPSLELNQEKPSRVFVASDTQKRDYYRHSRSDSFDAEGMHIGWVEYWDWSKSGHAWRDQSGGAGDWSNRNKSASEFSGGDTTCSAQISWPGATWPNLTNGVQIGGGDCEWSSMEATSSVSPPYIVMEHCDVTEATNANWEGWHWQTAEWEEWSMDDQYSRQAQTKLMLHTGGRGVPGVKNLFVISGNATEILDKRAVPPFYNGVATQPIPSEEITVLGKQLGSDGKMYVILPDNQALDITPVAKGKDFYTFSIGAQKYKSYFELYVEQPNPGYSFSPYNGDFGHVFWSFRTDAPSEAMQYVSTNLTAYLGGTWGFFPGTNGSICSSDPGQLSNSGQSGNIKRIFSIGFPNLLKGLGYVRGTAHSPPAYCWSGINCVAIAVFTGHQAGVHWLPGDQSPQNFGVTLIKMYPPILSPDPFYDEMDVFNSP